jgi:hypothetical protein
MSERNASSGDEQPDIEATRIVWEHPLEGTARELLAEAEGDQDDKVTKIEQAKTFLRAALAKGKKLQKDILAAALAEGFSEGTLRRAAKDEAIGKGKDGMDGPWYWWLT